MTNSYKSRLNEFCQKFHLSLPSYDTVKTDTGKGFVTTIVFNKKVYQSNGPQSTKKQAEQNAAQVVLHMLNQCPAPAPNFQDFVEECRKLASQNVSVASSCTETSTTVTSSTGKLPCCFVLSRGYSSDFFLNLSHHQRMVKITQVATLAQVLLWRQLKNCRKKISKNCMS